MMLHIFIPNSSAAMEGVVSISSPCSHSPWPRAIVGSMELCRGWSDTRDSDTLSSSSGSCRCRPWCSSRSYKTGRGRHEPGVETRSQYFVREYECLDQCGYLGTVAKLPLLGGLGRVRLSRVPVVAVVR